MILSNILLILAALFDASREVIDLKRYHPHNPWFTWDLKINKPLLEHLDAFHQYPFWSYLLWSVALILNPSPLFFAYWVVLFYQWRNLFIHIVLPQQQYRGFTRLQAGGFVAGVMLMIILTVLKIF